MKAKWIDIQNPTREDIENLRQHFGFHEVIAEEMLLPSVRGHAEFYEEYIFFTYNFPIYDQKEHTSRRAEVDFLITPTAVITTHYEHLEPLASLTDYEADTTFEFVYKILQSIFLFEERQLRHIREKVERISAHLFHNREKDILKKISFLKRDISEFRIIVRSADNVLASLRNHGTRWWGEEVEVYLNDMAGDHYKVISQIEDYRETVSDLELTNSYLMSAKATKVMQSFTAMSFLTFPFALFVAIFGLDVHGNPFLELENSFWILLTGVLLGISLLALYYKRKDWL